MKMKESRHFSVCARILVSVLIAAITIPCVLFTTADDVYAERVIIRIIYNDDRMPIGYVYGWVDDEDSESDPFAARYEGGRYVSSAEMASRARNQIGGVYSKDGKPVANSALSKQDAGDLANAAFSGNMPAGYNGAFTFFITVDGKAEYTLKDGTVSFFIPWPCQKEGRTYALLGIDKDGNVKIFDDADNDAYSFTANLDIEGFAFMLIYKD